MVNISVERTLAEPCYKISKKEKKALGKKKTRELKRKNKKTIKYIKRVQDGFFKQFEKFQMDKIEETFAKVYADEAKKKKSDFVPSVETFTIAGINLNQH